MQSLIIDKNSPKLAAIQKRGEILEGNYIETVQSIISDVIKRGDIALFELTKRFDNFNISETNIAVDKEEISSAYNKLDKSLIDAIKRSHDNVLAFHKLQMEKTWLHEPEGSCGNILIGQKITPLDSVGLYVPGGKATYFSSVLMNALPAKAAGVKDIFITTPAQNGEVNPAVLVAADICGVSKVFKVGGAQAVAALAYGTKSIPKVDKIVGPGNIYVATAKKLVFGKVDIDMIAGPSEVLIIADEKANAEYIAADMLAQAEHDELASAITITHDKNLALAVEKAVINQLEALPRKHIAEKSIYNNSAIILVNNEDESFDLANSIAPEHLELYLDNALSKMPKVRHAGAIFIGGYSPEAIGDYYAGPNHVLPTGGTAKFFSPLGTYDFFKRSSIIYYNQKALQSVAKDIIAIAQAENLTAHAQSVKERVK